MTLLGMPPIYYYAFRRQPCGYQLLCPCGHTPNRVVTVNSVYACTLSFVLSLIIESIRYKYKIECQLNRMILKYQISYCSDVFHVDPLF